MARDRASWQRLALLPALLALGWIFPAPASAHGFAGKRFFPATLAVDDPFVADEFNLMGSFIEVPDDGGVDTEIAGFSFDLAKRITSRFGIEAGGSYLRLRPEGGPSSDGLDNLSVGAKYLLAVLPKAETLFSLGLDADVGGTGSRGAGAESFSTLSPALFLGKGLGGLPRALRFLRPFALTAALGPRFATRSSEPVSFDWGLAFEYDLHYLQSFVQDLGIPSPFDQMMPVVELPLTTCLNRGCGGTTTGTVNPGVIWFTHWGQVGLEARVPIGNHTGNHVGALLQLHFYMDDLFPKSLGRPIFP